MFKLSLAPWERYASCLSNIYSWSRAWLRFGELPRQHVVNLVLPLLDGPPLCVKQVRLAIRPKWRIRLFLLLATLTSWRSSVAGAVIKDVLKLLYSPGAPYVPKAMYSNGLMFPTVDNGITTKGPKFSNFRVLCSQDPMFLNSRVLRFQGSKFAEFYVP